MTTNLDFNSPELFAPVVFRSTFNNFEVINPTQAWSLLFTGGKEDKALLAGVGLFYTNVLLALIGSGIAAELVIQNLFLA